MEYINELLNILNAMSPYLLLGFFVAGLLHIYLPKWRFSKKLSRKGLKSVSLSALFGVPLPLCSCGVIPTAMSLKKEGATDGATVSFLIATPQTGVDSILATYGVLGLPFAIIRPIVALIVGVVGGLFVDRFSGDKDKAKDKDQDKAKAKEVSRIETKAGVKVETKAGEKVGAKVGAKVETKVETKVGEKVGVKVGAKSKEQTECGSSCCSYLKGAKELTFIDALKYGFVDMLQDLGGWLTIGLVVAAAITAFVPSTIFEVLGDHYALNLLVVLLLSIPMYICSTGSIPIALSLLMMGVSPGAALIFLMAGPATNVATLTVLRKVLGTRTTLLYLLSIILGAIGFAIFIDFCLPAEWFTPKLAVLDDCTHCGTESSWWHLASSILFVVLLINAYMLKFFKGVSHSHGTVEFLTTQKFLVGDMRCNHCKANVERAISALPNVTSVSVDLASGVVEVEGSVSKEVVCNAVKPLGFEIETI